MPITQPDAAQTVVNTPVTIPVLANDQGSDLVIVGFGLPAHGSLVLNADKAFIYTPQAGFVGSDSFGYTVRDAGGAVASGEVTILVAAPNTPPVARDDRATAVGGGSVAVNVLANDSDPDGDALRLVAVGNPAYGSLQVGADQAIRYTPQQGFAGSDNLVYVIDDGRGGNASANLSIDVVRSSTPPVVGNDVITTSVGVAVVIAPLANDSDPDGDPLALAALTMPMHGSLAVNPDRTLTYTPAAGFAGSDSFTYTASDGRGGSGTAEVRVEVVRPTNTLPVAGNDAVTTSVGVPVLIAPLANDSDPDGDPLGLLGLTLPAHGSLLVNPDRTLTYTPAPGFTGSDGFTYTASDGRGGSSTGQVSITVSGPAPPAAYANGYGYRRRLVVPPQPVAVETVANFVVLVAEQGDWLKDRANGGKVESATGLDLRFELESGGKLDHEIERYDPVLGRLTAWVRLPSWRLDQALRLVLYYGKAAPAAGEANPAGVWGDYLAVWDSRTGADRTGRGRGLTPSNIAAGELIAGCGRFDGQSVATLGDPTWLNGLAAITVQAAIKADPSTVGSNRGLLSQGPMDGTDPSSGLNLRYMATAFDGQTPRTIHWKLKLAGNVSIFAASAAATQSSDIQFLHGTWRSGGVPDLFVDGRLSTPTSASSPGTGTIGLPAAPLYLGAGSLDSAAGGWRGLIDEVRIRGTALSAARIATEVSSYRDPQGFYGRGAEETPDVANRSPVAAPFAVTTEPGIWVNIDVLSRADDPDGTAGLRIVGIGAPGFGAANIVDGKIRYVPSAGFVGTDSFAYTITDGDKTSNAKITVTVVLAAASELPTPLRTVQVSGDNALATALAAAQPGDHIVLADGTYSSSHTLSASGTAVAPIVVKAANKLAARLTGGLTLKGNDGWAWGLTLAGAQLLSHGNRNHILRCLFDAGPDIVLRLLAGTDVEIGRCELKNLSAGRGISMKPASGGVRRPWIHHCRFRDFAGTPGTNVHEAIQLGEGSGDEPIDLGAIVERNLFENVNVDPEIISVKSSSNIVRFNTVLNCGSAHFTSRLGERNEYSANWFESSGSLSIFDRLNVALGNRLVNATDSIRVFAGKIAPTAPSDNQLHPAAWDTLLAGNVGDITVGYFYSADSATMTVNAKNTRIEQHTGDVAFSRAQDTTIVATTTRTIPQAVRLTAAEVGPNAP